MSRPNVLVTGSSGHLGFALMHALPSLGFCPVGIDIKPCETTNYVGSIADRGLISRIFAENPSLRHVLHAATLHKPHVGSHTKAEFVETNISGTLALLEEASGRSGDDKIESFVFISTTSTFGAALSPRPGEPAAWIDEAVVPQPKNVYGVTKVAAEDMCYLVHRQTGMPVLVLRTSRFFPEQDDDEDRRAAMGDANLKVCELAYRRVDIADVVTACECAMRKASEIRWGKYIISGPTPFANTEESLRRLDSDAGSVMREAVPACEKVFADRNWKFLSRIDRVYDSSKAIRELDWKPKYTFQEVVELLQQGKEWRSDLSVKVGKRGYHARPTGIYTA
ncbi:uncharacterized protein E0L32_002888 [Thyridium curvatum]|uniref:NAD-dependent epimerase/dehydratase domain-containing protein n=1 Tax=Thyridium curvatum TaxID=1093900 RepID=A0A507BCZ9_9PEZI|nr:uncharacterized protein E0L32_002888 [Thyridium curvatum]TPX17787.1 hypothetical protein E0L32_002888 [Thyridium curvatum]